MQKKNWAGGGGTKPGPKIRKDQAARPLAGAEVLVAVRGPSPGEGRGNLYRSPVSIFSFFKIAKFLQNYFLNLPGLPFCSQDYLRQ